MPAPRLETERIARRWDGGTCIIAASGPSLETLAPGCRGVRIIAVNDAYKLLPHADVLYACDAKWWDAHKGCPDFKGEKWSSHDDERNKKVDQALRYRLRTVKGKQAAGFSTNSRWIHYGLNGGFQACNLAILFGATRLLLVAFDMREVNGKKHFFGDHPPGLAQSSIYPTFIAKFDEAAKMLPAGIEIVNCTPGSALKCFPMMDLGDALNGRQAEAA